MDLSKVDKFSVSTYTENILIAQPIIFNMMFHLSFSRCIGKWEIFFICGCYVRVSLSIVIKLMAGH